MKRNVTILSYTFIFSLLIWFYINMNLSYSYSITLPFSIRSSKAQGVSNDVPQKVEVIFKAKGWSILKILAAKNLHYNLDLSYMNRDARIDLSQYIYDAVKFPDDVIVQSVTPSYIDITFDNIITRMVKVKNNTSVITSDGYTIIGYGRLSPDSVKITGAASIVTKIKSISTEQFVFRDVNSPITKEVKLLDTVGSQIKIEPSVVKVSYNIELSAEKEFPEIPITITGLPEDKEVMLVPPNITLTLRGGVEELTKINLNDFKVTVDFKQIEKDEQGSVEPQIELPEIFTLIKYEPSKFQYIIKKKIQDN